jgi:hypothetical protein
LEKSQASHADCLNRLSSLKDDLILFLCHGYADCILGCDFKSPQERFEYGPFIDRAKIDVLAGKKVIAFSCYSNGLAEMAIKAGVKVYIGFETIRFDYVANCEKGISFQKIRERVKCEIRHFLYDSITFAIDKGLDFDGLSRHMRIVLNNRLRNVLLSKHKHKEEIAGILLEIKTGMKVYGNRKATIL